MEEIVAYLKHRHSVRVCELTKITKTHDGMNYCKNFGVGLSNKVWSKLIGWFGTQVFGIQTDG